VSNHATESESDGLPTGRLIRVAVADDHPIFRIGLRALLGTEPGIELVGEAENGEQAIALVQARRPDVLLLDLDLPATARLDVLRHLAALNLQTRAVLLTTAIERGQMRTALLHGAWGVVLKHSAADLLIKCIRQVSRGEYWVGRESVGDLVEALRNPERLAAHADGLTPRERQVVSLVVTGASNRSIASSLGLNEQTVKNHLRKIFDKLQVANRVELALTAVEKHLVAPGALPLPSTRQP
jgi:DNA-binding NarL/FixJ family response regulator